MTDTNQEIIDVVAEWDANAEARHKQIISKIDISYHKVLVPTLLRLMGKVQGKQIIDVGCGSGVFAAELAERGANVIGVDPSREMIRIANREYGNKSDVKFYSQSIEIFAASFTDMKFDIAVSNMALVTIQDLDCALYAINSLLQPHGKLVFNITHPCYWNQYRQYESNGVFEYMKEHAQRGKFIISKDNSGLPSPTTHFHRPLQKYFQSLWDASFIVEKVVEPFPSKDVEKLYPVPWKFPRFLSMKCVKIQLSDCNCINGNAM